MSALASLLGPPIQEEKGPDGSARYWIVDRRIVVCEAPSSPTLRQVDLIMEIADEVIRQWGRIYLLQDWSQIERYQARSRTTMVRWAAKNAPSIVAGHFYVESPLMSMTLQAVRLTFGSGFNIVTSRPDFLAAMRDVRIHVQQKGARRFANDR